MNNFTRLLFVCCTVLIIASGLGEVIPGVPSYRLLYVKTGGMLKDRRVMGEYEVGGFFGSINRAIIP